MDLITTEDFMSRFCANLRKYTSGTGTVVVGRSESVFAVTGVCVYGGGGRLKGEVLVQCLLILQGSLNAVLVALLIYVGDGFVAIVCYSDFVSHYIDIRFESDIQFIFVCFWRC